MSYALSFYKVNLILKALELFLSGHVRVYVWVKKTEIANKCYQFSQLV